MVSTAFVRRRAWGAASGVALVLLVWLSGCAPRDSEAAARDASELRIVGLVPSLNELIVAMGAGDHLVARTDFDTDPAVMALPSVGGGLDPSLERLVALDLDVVLLAESRETPALAERLAALGIDTETIPTNTVEDVFTALDRIGTLLDEHQRADSLAEVLRTGLAEIRARVADRPVVSVMYVVWSDPPMTSGGGTFVDELIGIAGGRNVFDDVSLTWPNVGFESIVERDPDVLVWPESESTRPTVAALRERPGWRDVRAVQEGHVVFVDGVTFNRPGPELVASARELARALHPEAF